MSKHAKKFKKSPADPSNSGVKIGNIAQNSADNLQLNDLGK